MWNTGTSRDIIHLDISHPTHQSTGVLYLVDLLLSFKNNTNVYAALGVLLPYGVLAMSDSTDCYVLVGS